MRKAWYLLFILLAFMLVSGCRGANVESQKVELYYFNADGSKLIPEAREIKVDSEGTILTEVMKELLKGPSLQELKRAIPEGTNLLGISREGTVAIVDLSGEFSKASDIEQLWARFSVVNTLCDIDGVQKVKILVEGEETKSAATGEPFSALGKEDVVMDMPTTKTDEMTIVLYFADKDAMYLVPELREVALSEGESIESVIIRELKKGPASAELGKILPAEAKLLSAETKDGVCFLNFSQEFITKHWGGSTGERFTIYSIVNSLTEFPEIQKVQFLIEGKKADTFIHMVFNEPFVRNDEIMKK